MDIKESQIIDNLKASGLACPKLAGNIDEQSLLAVIEYFKAAELASGRFDSLDKVIKRYTHWACQDIALALHFIYSGSDKQKAIYISPSVAVSGFARLPTCHYALAFDGHFYDILGKHTPEEIEEYCKHEFCWQGAKFKPLTEADLSKYAGVTDPNFDNPVVVYCTQQILQNNPHLAAGCALSQK